MRSVAGFAVALCLASPCVRADWLELKDGRRVRGIDLKRRGSSYLFTLEDGKTVTVARTQIVSHAKSPRDEKVMFRGKETSLRRTILTLKREFTDRRRKAVRAIERWARGGTTADAARSEVMAAPAEERELFFCRALARSSSGAARKLAIGQLLGSASPRALSSLVRSAMADSSAEVRSVSMSGLLDRNRPRTGEYLIPYLGSSERKTRVRASLAIRDFPTLRAVPALFVTITKVWPGGSRSYFFQGTQRAYIADYELASGGTGFNLVEVADPVVRYAETGVVLDVNIVKAEQTIHLTTLEAVTGRRYGRDIKKGWDWWKRTGGKAP